jgi:flagellar biogenesis protein FliO
MEIESILRMFLSLAFVVGLIGLSAHLLKKLTESKHLSKLSFRRLKIEEQLYLDSRRKIVLVSKDGEEYMVLLGSNSEQILPIGKKPENIPSQSTPKKVTNKKTKK